MTECGADGCQRLHWPSASLSFHDCAADVKNSLFRAELVTFRRPSMEAWGEQEQRYGTPDVHTAAEKTSAFISCTWCIAKPKKKKKFTALQDLCTNRRHKWPLKKPIYILWLVMQSMKVFWKAFHLSAGVEEMCGRVTWRSTSGSSLRSLCWESGGRTEKVCLLMMARRLVLTKMESGVSTSILHLVRFSCPV